MISIFKKQQRLPNGPELWQKVLDYLSPHFDDCVIAGGCVRDYYLGKPPKDIDVFCIWNEKLETLLDYFIPGIEFEQMSVTEVQEHRKNSKKRIKDIIPGIKIVDKGGEYDLKSSDKGIQHVYYFDYLGYKINLITMYKSPITPILVTDTFDFNICKSAYYNGTIIDNPLAKYDRDNNIVTISELASYADDVQYKRFTRFNKKYDGRFKLRGVKKIIDVESNLPSDAVLLKYNDSLLDTSVGYKVGLVSFYKTIHKINPLREWLNGNKNAYVLIQEKLIYNTMYDEWKTNGYKFVQVKHLHKYKFIKYKFIKYYVMKV